LRGGRLSVSESSGAKVDVVVDNIVVGKAPWEGTLPVGVHTVILRGDGDLGAMPAAVDIKLNQLAKIQLLAEPLACKLRVEPTPASAIVAIDSAEVGRGIWSGAVRCGGHLVEVADKGYLTGKRQVSVAKDREQTVIEKLERDPNSDDFKAANPSRITLGLYGSMPFAFGVGGHIDDNCGATCTSGPGFGVAGTVRIGYRLPVGLGFGVDIGALYLRTKYDGRDETLDPTGALTNFKGTASDLVEVRSAPMVGLHVSYDSKGERAQFGARLSGGVASVSVSDRRNFRFTSPAGVPDYSYNIEVASRSGASDSNRAVIGFIRPDLHIGIPLSKKLVFEFGAEAWVLVGADAVKFSTTSIPAGNINFANEKCPVKPASDCYAGIGTFHKEGAQPDSIVGGVVFLPAPYLGMRLEL
jgi:hypothetical protein